MKFEEAKAMCSNPHSGFSWVTTVEHMSLPPKYQGHIGEGIREQLDSRIGVVCEKYEGAITHYSDIRVLGDRGVIIDDSPFINFDISVNFIVFQPRVGSVLEGVVNKMGKDHIGLVVHGHFNVSIRLTGEDTTVSKGDTCEFTVVWVHTHRNLLSMTGRLV